MPTVISVAITVGVAGFFYMLKMHPNTLGFINNIAGEIYPALSFTKGIKKCVYNIPSVQRDGFASS
jgi:hypothetical protein